MRGTGYILLPDLVVYSAHDYQHIPGKPRFRRKDHHPVCHFGRQQIRQYSTGSEAQCGFLGSDPGGTPSEWQAPGICDPGMALGAWNLSRRSTAIPGTWGTGFFRRASAWKSRFPKVRRHPLSAAMNYMTDWPLAVF